MRVGVRCIVRPLATLPTSMGGYPPIFNPQLPLCPTARETKSKSLIQAAKRSAVSSPGRGSMKPPAWGGSSVTPSFSPRFHNLIQAIIHRTFRPFSTGVMFRHFAHRTQGRLGSCATRIQDRAAEISNEGTQAYRGMGRGFDAFLRTRSVSPRSWLSSGLAWHFKSRADQLDSAALLLRY